MQTIITSILTFAIGISSSTSSLAFMVTPPPSTSDAVVAAIQKMDEHLTTYKDSSQKPVTVGLIEVNKQLVELFDCNFKGICTMDGKKNTGNSVIRIQFKEALKDFFSVPISNRPDWDLAKNFSGLPFTPTSTASTNIENLVKTADDMVAIRKLLSQEAGYNTKRFVLDKTQDDNATLKQPFETDTTITSMKNSAYGSLDDNSPTADNVPNIGDLLGYDAYNEKQQDKAKMFIRYVLLSTPTPVNFYIPPSSKKGDDVAVFLPIPNTADKTPYTTVNVQTKANGNLYKSEKIQNEYDRMIDYLNNDQTYYQPYTLKVRTANVLRSLYTESLARAYQERIKDKTDNKSLIEREKDLAYAGLNKEYYDKLKTKSMADINLETLQALNKLAYFVYKLHQDNERMSLIMATSGLRLAASQGAQDEMNYINPLSRLIVNKCWDIKYETGSDDNAKARIKACNDPKAML